MGRPKKSAQPIVKEVAPAVDDKKRKRIVFDDDDNALGDDGEIVELPIVEESSKKRKKEVVVEESDDDDAPEVQTKAGASSVAKELAMKEKEAVRVQQEREKAKRREKEDLRQQRAKEAKALKEAQAALEAQKKAEEGTEEEEEDDDLPEDVLKAVAAHHEKTNSESKAVLAFNRQQEIIQKRRAKLKGERPAHANSKVADYEVKKGSFKVKVLASNPSEALKLKGVSESVLSFQTEHLYGSRVQRTDSKRLSSSKRKVTAATFRRS